VRGSRRSSKSTYDRNMRISLAINAVGMNMREAINAVSRNMRTAVSLSPSPSLSPFPLLSPAEDDNGGRVGAGKRCGSQNCMSA
jgi:hypothetical protein